jgi:hypothetical protein
MGRRGRRMGAKVGVRKNPLYPKAEGGLKNPPLLLLLHLLLHLLQVQKHLRPVKKSHRPLMDGME